MRSKIFIARKTGFAFIEVLISVLLIGLIGAAYFSAMGTASRSVALNDEQQTSKNLAEMQLEYLASLPYSDSYLPADIPTEQESYSVQTGADGRIWAEAIAGRDNRIQKLRVTILRNGKEVITVSGFKVQ
jgi:type II secretory pathway pseudopilin PulG